MSILEELSFRAYVRFATTDDLMDDAVHAEGKLARFRTLDVPVDVVDGYRTALRAVEEELLNRAMARRVL